MDKKLINDLMFWLFIISVYVLLYMLFPFHRFLVFSLVVLILIGIILNCINIYYDYKFVGEWGVSR